MLWNSGGRNQYAEFRAEGNLGSYLVSWALPQAEARRLKQTQTWYIQITAISALCSALGRPVELIRHEAGGIQVIQLPFLQAFKDVQHDFVIQPWSATGASTMGRKIFAAIAL